MSVYLDKVDLSSLDALIVDDNLFIGRLLTDILHSFGLGKVRHAPSVADAFYKIGVQKPDVILCDWLMTPVDGIGFLRALRGKTGTQDIPVIMITAHATPEHVSAAMGEGADSYIVKPFSAATLMEHLLKALFSQKADYI